MKSFVCPNCGVECYYDFSRGDLHLGACPSCGHKVPRPIQSPLFLIPDPPRATRWKIEWQWSKKAIDEALTLWKEILPEGWFFHSECNTERIAVNDIRRMRARQRRWGLKHYRMKPCLWNHSGDIELNVFYNPPELPASLPSDFAIIDQLIAEGKAIAAADAMTLEDFSQKYIVPAVKMASPDPDTSTDPSTFQSLYLEPHCGPDFCVKDGCPIHGTPDPWDEKQLPGLIDEIIAP